MCIIVKQPKGHRMTRRQIADFYRRNSDGFGVMYVDGDGKLQAWVALPVNAQHAIKLYRELAHGRECVFHYRMATHGPVDGKHCHPFWVVDEELAVMHNGVFSGMGSATESDTAEMVRTVFRPLFKDDPTRIEDPSVRAFLESEVKGSAVVFMDRSGKIHRFGNAGVEYQGCWYSNLYAWDAPAYLYGGTGRGGWRWGGDDGEDWIASYRSRRDLADRRTVTIGSRIAAELDDVDRSLDVGGWRWSAAAGGYVRTERRGDRWVTRFMGEDATFDEATVIEDRPVQEPGCILDPVDADDEDQDAVDTRLDKEIDALLSEAAPDPKRDPEAASQAWFQRRYLNKVD